MTKGEHLGVKRSPAAEQGSERAKNGQNGKHHSCISLAQLREILNDCGVDQVLGRHSQSAKLKTYNKCKKDELKGKDGSPVTSTQELQDACMGTQNPPNPTIPDPKKKIEKACDTKLASAITGKCADLNLAKLFPGTGATPAPTTPEELKDFVDFMVECEVCLALNEIDGMNRDCDLFDDGVANGSCGEEPLPPPPLPPLLDHFKFYGIDGQSVDFPVTLSDQFFDEPNVTLTFRSAFLNPVKKTIGQEVTDIADPLAHLTMYFGLTDLSFTPFPVAVRNQFGDQTLTLLSQSFGTVILLVPTRKEQLGPSPSLDHYRCYTTVQSSFEIEGVRLQDQFDDPNEHVVTVLGGQGFFCAPTDKNGEGIQNPEDHLTCYGISPQIDPNIQINVGDQFDPNTTITIGSSSALCVPSEKLGFCGDEVVGLGEECDPPNDSACSGECLSNCRCGPAKQVFVTFLTFNGNLGGLAGADAKCQARADAGSLSGTYKAWLATGPGDDPNTNFTKSTKAYALTDGAVIANDWADLTDGTLFSPINKDEFGASTSGQNFVWTGVLASGVGIGTPDCSDWSDPNSGSGRVGGTFYPTSLWSDLLTIDCTTLSRLYCFEQ